MENSSNSNEILNLINSGNYYLNAKNEIDKYFGFNLFIFGLFGNIFIIYLMKNVNFSKLTILIYLIGLAISDIFVLVF